MATKAHEDKAQKPVKKQPQAQNPGFDLDQSSKQAEKEIDGAKGSPEPSLQDRIAATMRLAGGLRQASGILEEEIRKASEELKKDSPSIESVDTSLINMPNPVLGAIDNSAVNVTAVMENIAENKAQIQERNEKASVLVRLLQEWKAELEDKYPLMKRNTASATRRDSIVDNVLAQRTAVSRKDSPAKEEGTRESTVKRNATPIVHPRPSLITDHAATDTHFAASTATHDLRETLQETRQAPWLKNKTGYIQATCFFAGTMEIANSHASFLWCAI